MCCMMQILNLMLKSVRMVNALNDIKSTHSLAALVHPCTHTHANTWCSRSKGWAKVLMLKRILTVKLLTTTAVQATESMGKKTTIIRNCCAVKNTEMSVQTVIREIEMKRERERSGELQCAICAFFCHADKYSTLWHTHSTVAHQFTKARTNEWDKSVPEIECKPKAYHMFNALLLPHLWRTHRDYHF